MKRTAAAALIFSVASPCALAADWYAGVGAGQSQDGPRENAYTLRLGTRLNPSFAIEGGYFNLGEHGGARARSYGISAVATAPLDRLDIYGRIGYARTDFGGERENEAIAGVGLRWNVAPQWGVFAEYQKHDKLEIDSWYVGLDWRF